MTRLISLGYLIVKCVKMRCHSALIILVGCAFVSTIVAQSVIPGKFDVFNHKPVLLRDTADKVDDQTNKIFSFGSNRAPLHDTPASKCKCSE